MFGKKIFITLGLFFIASITANAATVDLDARSTTTSNPVLLNLTAGTYDVTPVKRAYTAWNAWSTVSGCDNSGENCSTGWINTYSIDTTETSPFITGDSSFRYRTADQALLNALSTTFTLLSDATVKFFISDNPYTDNSGGMSLNVTPSGLGQVPLPAAAFMFAPALLGFLGLRRRAKNTIA